MRKIFNKKVASKVRNLMLAGTLIATPMMLVQGCTFGDDGGSSTVTNNDTCQDGDTTCNPGDDDDEDPVVDDGSTITLVEDGENVTRTVLANTFNQASADEHTTNLTTPTVANDIEPEYRSITRMTGGGDYGTTNYYDSGDMNTLRFDSADFEAGKKYYFEGELDSEGKVVQRIIINGANVTDIDIKVIDAQLSFNGQVYGNSKIYLDMPCYDTYLIEGRTIKVNPKPLLDKTPTLQVNAVMSDTTVVKAPGGTKKEVGGILTTMY